MFNISPKLYLREKHGQAVSAMEDTRCPKQALGAIGWTVVVLQIVFGVTITTISVLFAVLFTSLQTPQQRAAIKREKAMKLAEEARERQREKDRLEREGRRATMPDERSSFSSSPIQIDEARRRRDRIAMEQRLQAEVALDAVSGFVPDEEEAGPHDAVFDGEGWSVPGGAGGAAASAVATGAMPELEADQAFLAGERVIVMDGNTVEMYDITEGYGRVPYEITQVVLAHCRGESQPVGPRANDLNEIAMRTGTGRVVGSVQRDLIGRGREHLRVITDLDREETRVFVSDTPIALGNVGVTDVAGELVNELGLDLSDMVEPHANGYYGPISDERVAANREATRAGEGVVRSAYRFTLDGARLRLCLLTEIGYRTVVYATGEESALDLFAGDEAIAS